MLNLNIKEMLLWEINNTCIDYNRGYNLLWDLGLEDSKRKEYYMLDKPIKKPTFINVSFILEKILLNKCEIDRINLFPAVGKYTNSRNLEISIEKTKPSILGETIKELEEIARELGYIYIQSCPISYTGEVLFRKIGTWNKPYIMRKRRSRYLKSSWNAMTDRFGSLKPYINKYKWDIPSRGTKSNKELEIERFYSTELSKKVPKKIQKEWNFWAQVILDHEQMVDYYEYNDYVTDAEREESQVAFKEVQNFIKNSKLGLMTMFKNADKFFPRNYQDWGAYKNDVLKYLIAWKQWRRIAAPWIARKDGSFDSVAGIGTILNGVLNEGYY